MSFACITSHQLYYISSSLHHLDALHHLTSEYSNTVNLMYYTRRHMYYMGFTFTDVQARESARPWRPSGWTVQPPAKTRRSEGLHIAVRSPGPVGYWTRPEDCR